MATRKIRRNREEIGGNGSAGDVEVRRDADENSRELHGEPESIGGEGEPELGTFNPASESSEPGSGGEPERRKGGRPRGSRNKRREKEETPNLTAELLLEVHVMLAALTDTEELLLNPEEAERLAKSIARVEALYKPEWLSEETRAWTGLLLSCGAIYGPRVMAVYKKTRDARPIDIAVMPANRETGT